MAEVLELLHNVPVFAGIPEDQIDWFLSQSRVMSVKAGETYARQGDPADAMFVLLEGDFQWRGEFSGETIFRDLTAGEVTGILPFSLHEDVLAWWAGRERWENIAIPGITLSGTCASDA